MTTIQAGGGAVYRLSENEYEVLLIFKRDVWDLPKGKKEQGEGFEACARREVAEETGVRAAVESSLTVTRHQYERSGQQFTKITHWFAMRSEEGAALKPQKEEGIAKAEWIPLQEATERVGYANLVEVLEKLKKLLN